MCTIQKWLLAFCSTLHMMLFKLSWHLLEFKRLFLINMWDTEQHVTRICVEVWGRAGLPHTFECSSYLLEISDTSNYIIWSFYIWLSYSCVGWLSKNPVFEEMWKVVFLWWSILTCKSSLAVIVPSNCGWTHPASKEKKTAVQCGCGRRGKTTPLECCHCCDHTDTCNPWAVSSWLCLWAHSHSSSCGSTRTLVGRSCLTCNACRWSRVFGARSSILWQMVYIAFGFIWSKQFLWSASSVQAECIIEEQQATLVLNEKLRRPLLFCRHEN